MGKYDVMLQTEPFNCKLNSSYNWFMQACIDQHGAVQGIVGEWCKLVQQME